MLTTLPNRRNDDEAAMSNQAPLQFAPGPLELPGKCLYGMTYCLSYGVVLGILLMGLVIPGRSIMGKAMLDATGTARRDLMRIRRKRPVLNPPSPLANSHAAGSLQGK